MVIEYYLDLRSRRRTIPPSVNKRLHSKKIISYHPSKQMTKDIIVKVLQNAYFSQKLKGEIILYTDLESHYTIQDFKDVT